MMQKVFRFFLVTLIFTITLLSINLALPAFAENQPQANSDPVCRLSSKNSCLYADAIPEDGYKPTEGQRGVNIEKYGQPNNALNAPDVIENGRNNYLHMVSLGNTEFESEEEEKNFKPENITNVRTQCKAYLIIQFSKLGIYDGPGYDFKIYEVGLNIGSGAEENIFVYVSSDNEDWFYIGRTVPEVDDVNYKGAFDLKDLALDDDERIHYVAMCEDPSDGETSSYFWGGADIDAVAALNFGSPPDAQAQPAAQAIGQGNTVNNQPLADNQIVPLQKGDKIGLAKVGGMDITAICRNKKFVARFSATVKLAELLGSPVKPGELKLANAILDQCQEQARSTTAAQTWAFDLQDGSFDLLIPQGMTDLTINTPTASVSTLGKARYDVAYDAADQVTTIWARDGSLTITPANSDLDPFELPAGVIIPVSQDNVGQPSIISESFVPLIIR